MQAVADHMGIILFYLFIYLFNFLILLLWLVWWFQKNPKFYTYFSKSAKLYLEHKRRHFEES